MLQQAGINKTLPVEINGKDDGCQKREMKEEDNE